MIILERKTSKGTWVRVSAAYEWLDSQAERATTSLIRESSDSPDDEFRLSVYEFSRELKSDIA